MTTGAVLQSGAAKRPAVVAVVVSWNSGPWLPACLEALAVQSGPDLRIVVWDNGSEPATLAVIDALALRFPRVTFHRDPRNVGFAAGNNRAIALAGASDFVLTVNPDVTLSPDCAARLLDVLQQEPGTAAVGATQLSTDGRSLDGVGDVLHFSGIGWRAGHGRPLAALGDALAPRDIFAPCAAVAMYRRASFDAAGGFDEDFFCYFEDVDLGYRLRLAGNTCRHAPQARAVHVGSVSAGRDSDFTIYHGHRNLVWSFVKNTPGPLLALLLPAHLVMTLFVALVFATRGRARIILRAKVDALRGLPAMLRKRRRIQAARTAGAFRIIRSMRFDPRRR